MMIEFTRHRFHLLALAAAAGTSQPTLAQSNAGIEEILVTAQKRAESLQEVPLAISAFSGDQLREDGVAGLEDIGNRTPGMVFAAFSAGQPEIAIRGIGTKEDGAAASDSTVVSIDDVYIAARTAQVFDIFDLERVEVLRGPQGTLYGKNSIGGSINFVTSKPGEKTEVRVRQSFGNYGRNDTGGLLSGALAENLFGKIAFSRRESDGFLRHLPSGDDWGEQETLAWRAQLRWLLNDDIEIMFSADGADDELGASNREPVGGVGRSGNGDNLDPLAVNRALGGAGDPYTTLAETEGFTDRQVNGYSVKVNWALDAMTLTSITSYRESDFDWLEDSEGLPPSSAGPGAPAATGFFLDVNNAAVEDTQQVTQELRLTSSGNIAVEWVLGVFYSLEDIERAETFPFTSFASEQTSFQENESTSWAVYGQGSYNFTDDLSLTAGLRYSTEEKEIKVANEVTGAAVLLQPFDTVAADESWDNVSGRLALDWAVAEDILLYGSVSTGFKSGGFTGSSSTAERATTPFDPEEATSFEIGLKSQWWENRLRLNASVFYTDYEDLQVTRFFLPAGGTFGEFITENAATATIDGIEIEFMLVPTEALELGGSFAYLNAEFDEFTPSTPNDDGAGNPVIPDFSGNKLRQAPRKTASFYTKYHWDLDAMGRLTAKLDYRFQDHSFYDPDNNAQAVIPRYRLWDARLAWQSANDQWEVAAWVKNLREEEYRTHVFTQRGGEIAFAPFGPPRTSGVTVTYSY
ncbi:TonB-dependent receptor [Exilibacterium tricleocarpae]|uniref:TonB-dependent receptor n=1 Tax=Exilibacterium tricleocarpae TaxID=2591008 RepID=A0A545U3E9_9GAMM|nr:TonB-dependent receptor [Exilibacterium tricleocarpae]TQV84002.1 TonB-dependent receptor [Exilibacterium tricleocarpae]